MKSERVRTRQHNSNILGLPTAFWDDSVETRDSTDQTTAKLQPCFSSETHLLSLAHKRSVLPREWWWERVDEVMHRDSLCPT